MNEKDVQNIQKFEEIGMDVIAIHKDGTLAYATQGKGDTEHYCDQCEACKLFPDPDPDDWFRDGDMKAVCLKLNAVIRGSLETPGECIHIRKPLYCPKLGRSLSKEEKEKAKKALKIAKERM